MPGRQFVYAVLKVGGGGPGEPFKCSYKVGLVVIVKINLLLQRLIIHTRGECLVKLLEPDYFAKIFRPGTQVF